MHGGRAVKSDDLVDGTTVMCHYTYAAGKLYNLFGGGCRYAFGKNVTKN